MPGVVTLVVVSLNLLLVNCERLYMICLGIFGGATSRSGFVYLASLKPLFELP